MIDNSPGRTKVLDENKSYLVWGRVPGERGYSLIAMNLTADDAAVYAETYMYPLNIEEETDNG